MTEDRKSFDELVACVHRCTRCERMAQSQRVFGYASGSTLAPLMFIGEAPGRLGADATSIPFHGDKAGENFERLIAQVGISRYDCFVTNAVLCNPKDDKGNNATPTKTEVENCSNFLRRQIDLIDPKIVVTLGSQALQALRRIEQHEFELASSVRKAHSWYDRLLLPLYHPGQRAMLHRSFLNQLADYQFVSEHLRQKKARRPIVGATTKDAATLVELILREHGPITYFRLHKLFYLIEYHSVRKYEKRLTNSYAVRQKDGPYFTDLHISKLRKALPQLLVRQSGSSLMLSVPQQSTLFAPSSAKNEVADLLSEIKTRYSAMSDKELKSVVYLTFPMRALLREEKYGGANLFNAPINFTRRNKSVTI